MLSKRLCCKVGPFIWRSTGIGYPQSQEVFQDTEVFEAFTLASFYLIILGFSFVPQIPQTQ